MVQYDGTVELFSVYGLQGLRVTKTTRDPKHKRVGGIVCQNEKDRPPTERVFNGRSVLFAPRHCLSLGRKKRI